MAVLALVVRASGAQSAPPSAMGAGQQTLIVGPGMFGFAAQYEIRTHDSPPSSRAADGTHVPPADAHASMSVISSSQLKLHWPW